MIDPSGRAISNKTLCRIVSVSGLVASMAFVVGGAWLQMAGLEAIDANGGAVLAAVSENRTSLLACYVLWNVDIMVQLVFLVALSLLVFRAGQLFLALFGGLSGVVLTGLMLTGFMFPRGSCVSCAESFA